MYEARARFTICVYEVSSEKERVRAMIITMNATQVAEEFEAYFSRKYPLLKGVIDADNGEFEGFDTFLTSWKTVLGTRGNMSHQLFKRSDLNNEDAEIVYSQAV